MNGREALKALADGKKVRRVYADGSRSQIVEFGDCHQRLSDFVCEAYPWEIVEEPATDEELIAEMERRSEGRASHVVAVYKECANMLRTRKVLP